MLEQIGWEEFGKKNDKPGIVYEIKILGGKSYRRGMMETLGAFRLILINADFAVRSLLVEIIYHALELSSLSRLIVCPILSNCFPSVYAFTFFYFYP